MLSKQSIRKTHTIFYKVKGNTFEIIREDNQHRNNKGEIESPFIKTLEE